MSRGILKTQFIHIYLLFLIRILKPKNHSQFFVNLGRIVAMRIPNKRKAAGRKKNRLMVLIECVIMIFFIMLWIFYPNTVVRNLTITLNPEENRIVYYVPGNLISAEVSSDQVTYELKTEEYVQNYDERDIPAKYTSWVKRRIQIHNIIQNCFCRLLIFFPVTGGLVFHASILHVIIYELVFLSLWLISFSICLGSSLRIKYNNISNLFQTRPCLAIWCEYKLRNFAGDEYRWSIAALTFPAYMTKNQTFVESAFLADRIWELYHRKNKGIYHLQYHYIQFCNFHYLGNEFIAQYHLEMINTELNNVPRVFIYKKYYAAVQRKVNLILDDAP